MKKELTFESFAAEAEYYEKNYGIPILPSISNDDFPDEDDCTPDDWWDMKEEVFE